MTTRQRIPSLLIALATGFLFALSWHLAFTASTQVAPIIQTTPDSDETFLFWQEDFSAPVLSTTYYITATPGSGIVSNTSFLLTQDASSQHGRIFYRTKTLMNDFTATFQINLGDENADGLAFLFCPTYDYPALGGGALDASCPDGYIIAFDTYEDQRNTLYIARDDTSHRIASTYLDMARNTWYTVEVAYHRPFITVTAEGDVLLGKVALPDSRPFFGYFGFSAATGGRHSEHRVDEITIYTSDPSFKLWSAHDFQQRGPGETAIYTLTLFNNTGITDDFALTLGEHQWPTSLSLDHTGPLTDGTSLDFTVYVTIPQTTTLYEDKVIVQAASVSSPTYTDTVTLHTDSRCRARLNDSPESYASIQAAVDASTHPTDVVKVAGYCARVNDDGGVRQVVFLSKTLTIQGGYTYTRWTDPDPAANPTTVDARGEGRVFFITNTITPTIESLRITGGDASGLGGYEGKDSGGGLYVSRAAATIRNCEIYGNLASNVGKGYGGGVAFYASPSILTNNAIHDNLGCAGINDNIGVGGGIAVLGSARTVICNNQVISNIAAAHNKGYGGGITLQGSSHIHIFSNTLQTNHGSDDYNLGVGGGIEIEDSANLTLATNIFLSNTAGTLNGKAHTSYGGGLAIWHKTHDVLILNNTFRSNQGVASQQGEVWSMGGGAFIYYTEHLTFTANTLISNTAVPKGGGYGGGLSLLSVRYASVTGNYIQSNRSNAGAGTGWGGGVDIFDIDWLTFTSNIVLSNVAAFETGQGGGIQVQQSANVYLSDNTLAYNDGVRTDGDNMGFGHGGGIDISDSENITLTDNLLRFNAANRGHGEGVGGGIAIDSGAQLFLQGNTFRNNIAATDGDGFGGGLATARDSDNNTIQLNRNLILSNTATLSPTATGKGGGFYYDNDEAEGLRGENNVIARNHANTEGSALYLVGTGSLTHTTFADNLQTVALFLEDASLQMTNTIIAGHTTGISGTTDSVAILNATLWHGNQTDFITSSMTLTTTDDYTGDPAFVNPEGGDYHISNGSEAIDKGIPTSLREDLDNAPRPCGKAPDLGADEICHIFLPLVLRNH